MCKFFYHILTKLCLHILRNNILECHRSEKLRYLLIMSFILNFILLMFFLQILFCFLFRMDCYLILVWKYCFFLFWGIFLWGLFYYRWFIIVYLIFVLYLSLFYTITCKLTLYWNILLKLLRILLFLFVSYAFNRYLLFN